MRLLIPGLPDVIGPTAGTRITLALNQIPLLEALKYVASQAGLKVKVEPYAVSIVPVSEQTDVMVTADFHVPPNFFRGTDARTFLEASGVTFPPGASATYLPSTSKLVVRNTQENVDLVAAVIGVPKPSGHYGPQLNDSRVAGLLPIRLDLPANGQRYDFAGGGHPDTLEFRYTDWRTVARWRWVC